MRDRPASPGDPYATLGLERGATMAEVKRAYRRLAKAFHPDSAGEAALSRFLAIHEAYEAIRTGRPMARSRGASPAAGGTGSAGAAGPEPWRADPERARAARERAGRRGKSAPSGSPRGPAGGTGSAGGRAGSGARTSTSGGTRGGGRRNVRKATMGSTSYDDARDPNDATWSGASWYGPSTGEYWIVNPREYADPRKHGPEYQSRARRPADAGEEFVEAGATGSPGATGTADAADAAGAENAAGAADSAWTFDRGGAEGRTTSTGRTPPAGDGMSTAEAASAGERSSAGETTSSAGAAPTGRTEPFARPDRPRRGQWSARDGAAAGGDAGAADWGAAWPADARTIRRARGAGLVGNPRDWIGGAADDPVRRLGLSLVAWPPIGLAAAAVIGDLTGCTGFSAACDGTEPLLPWLAQAVILGLLLLLPPIARILAGGSIGVLFALVPVTAFLVAVGGTGAPQAGFALTFFLAVAWLAGVAWAGRQQLRPAGARSAP